MVWRKSSRSGDGPNCVEATCTDTAQAEPEGEWHAPPLYLLRDSKLPNGPVIAVTPSEWDVFLNGVKGGGFG
ncbi:DUF397 domain-containing protein [Sphaerisporangium sp. NPDC049002]